MEIVNHEYYVSLEVAKLLKEAGFNWECLGAYFRISDEVYKFYQYANDKPLNWNNSTDYSTPTLEVAQRWLRETQKYQVAVLPNGLKGYAALCFLYKEPITQPFEYYSTYEEALEVGIKRVLEIILEKGE